MKSVEISTVILRETQWLKMSNFKNGTRTSFSMKFYFTLCNALSDKTFTFTTISDKEVCYAIQKGILASRSTVFYYNHNDLDHLVELLEKQAAEDRKVRDV